MAEGGGLLNRYRVKSSIGGSNPPLSAIESFSPDFGTFSSPKTLAFDREIAIPAEFGESPERSIRSGNAPFSLLG